MMGSRSSEPTGADALTGLLALVADPNAQAKKLQDIAAEMARLTEARAELRTEEAAAERRRTELAAKEADLVQREATVAEDLATIEKLRAEHASDLVAFTDREAGFVARDKARDDKAAAERAAIKDERAALERERAETETGRANLKSWCEQTTRERAALFDEQASVAVQAKRIADTFAALSAIINAEG